MCNPRRIHVTATRDLAEAWEHEILRVVTRSGEVSGEARLVEALDESLGAPTLVALEQALSTADGWERDGDSYRHLLDGGYVSYHPDTRQLEIVAHVSAEVSVEGTATDVVRGEFTETIEAQGVGVYYDDLYDGVTEADAQVAAQADVERNLEARRQELLDAARGAAEQERADELDRAASERADAELARRREERAAELRAQAQQRLTAVGIQGRNIFHRVLADAYRDAILAYARARGADGLVYAERDGVVEIEFELRA